MLKQLREILFKAKRLDNGEWVFGYYILNDYWEDNGGVEHMYREHHIYSHMIVDGHGGAYEVDLKTLCQYTGMTDISGYQIYEHDVLEDGAGDTGIVEYNSPDGMFVLNIGEILYSFSTEDSHLWTLMGSAHDYKEE